MDDPSEKTGRKDFSYGDLPKSMIIDYMNNIYADPVGRYLIDNIDKNRGYINFVIDKSLSYDKMKVTRSGYEITIYCNIASSYGKKLYQSLIFHELFHTYQRTGKSYELNSEIEAYMAQLHYLQRLTGEIITGPNNEFWHSLRSLDDLLRSLDYLLGNNSYSKIMKKFNSMYEDVIIKLRLYDTDYERMKEHSYYRNFEQLEELENLLLK